MKTSAKRPSLSELPLVRQRLDRAFRLDSAAPGTTWTVPSAGHCAAVAAIVEAEFGGKLVSTVLQGQSHWFNRLLIDGQWRDIDLTGDQFGFAPVQCDDEGSLYGRTRLRERDELNAETLSRASALARRAGFDIVARRLAAASRRRMETVAA
jgi:hypothetical protein